MMIQKWRRGFLVAFHIPWTLCLRPGTVICVSTHSASLGILIVPAQEEELGV